MDLLRPEYTEKHREAADRLRSRLNVAGSLLDARLALGLTQEELGKLAGTKQSRVSEIEAMKGNVRFDTLDRIARIVGLAIDLVPRRPAQPVPSGFHQSGEPFRAEGVAYAGVESQADWSIPLTPGASYG
jgi:transcriptional regulator with XRE-family HTH domain